MGEYLTQNDAFIIPRVNYFLNRLDQNFTYYKQLRSEYEKELDYLDRTTRGSRDLALNNRRKAVNYQIYKMDEGEGEFFIFNYLSDHGFLSNYGFSSSHISLLY